MLDRIKARHLLTTAQANLAALAGVSTFPRSHQLRATIAWRDALGPSTEVSDRLATARNLLSTSRVQSDPKASQFIQSEAGMRLVCEHPSSIRAMGDNAAHPSSRSTKLFRDTVSRHEESEGLTAIMHFVCID